MSVELYEGGGDYSGEDGFVRPQDHGGPDGRVQRRQKPGRVCHGGQPWRVQLSCREREFLGCSRRDQGFKVVLQQTCTRSDKDPFFWLLRDPGGGGGGKTIDHGGTVALPTWSWMRT